jgi:hypothetical protein
VYGFPLSRKSTRRTDSRVWIPPACESLLRAIICSAVDFAALPLWRQPNSLIRVVISGRETAFMCFLASLRRPEATMSSFFDDHEKEPQLQWLEDWLLEWFALVGQIFSALFAWLAGKDEKSIMPRGLPAS